VPSQLRIYKIKQGLMDQWLVFFNTKVVPLHRKFGIPAKIAWINHADSEFIWVRDFDDGEPIEQQETRYVTSEERRRVIGDESKSYIESMTVRVVTLAYEEAK
jgi:NIPSNAP